MSCLSGLIQGTTIGEVCVISISLFFVEQNDYVQKFNVDVVNFNQSAYFEDERMMRTVEDLSPKRRQLNLAQLKLATVVRTSEDQ